MATPETVTGEQARDPQRIAPFDRVVGARLVVFAITAVLIVFVATGVLSLTYAAIAVAIAAGEAVRQRSPGAAPAAAGAAAALATGPIEAMLNGLPDPVVALDRDGIVLAFNAPASALAPLLRQGEPASFALRMPEVVEAIRRASASGAPQRAEFSERVPVDRWYEVYVTALRLDRQRSGTRPDLVLMTFHDLTPLRRVEEMRADFVANASHELRTPLATLTGFI